MATYIDDLDFWVLAGYIDTVMDTRDTRMVANDSLRMIEPIIRQYLRVLRRNGIQPKQAYLYGSHARGTADSDSDIDVAIVSEDLRGSMFAEQMRLMRLTWNVDLRIEPHPFRPEDFTSDNPEAQEVLETGMPIE